MFFITTLLQAHTYTLPVDRATPTPSNLHLRTPPHWERGGRRRRAIHPALNYAPTGLFPSVGGYTFVHHIRGSCRMNEAYARRRHCTFSLSYSLLRKPRRSRFTRKVARRYAPYSLSYITGFVDCSPTHRTVQTAQGPRSLLLSSQQEQYGWTAGGPPLRLAPMICPLGTISWQGGCFSRPKPEVCAPSLTLHFSIISCDLVGFWSFQLCPVNHDSPLISATTSVDRKINATLKKYDSLLYGLLFFRPLPPRVSKNTEWPPQRDRRGQQREGANALHLFFGGDETLTRARAHSPLPVDRPWYDRPLPRTGEI